MYFRVVTQQYGGPSKYPPPGVHGLHYGGPTHYPPNYYHGMMRGGPHDHPQQIPYPMYGTPQNPVMRYQTPNILVGSNARPRSPEIIQEVDNSQGYSSCKFPLSEHDNESDSSDDNDSGNDDDDDVDNNHDLANNNHIHHPMMMNRGPHQQHLHMQKAIPVQKIYQYPQHSEYKGWDMGVPDYHSMHKGRPVVTRPMPQIPRGYTPYSYQENYTPQQDPRFEMPAKPVNKVPVKPNVEKKKKKEPAQKVSISRDEIQAEFDKWQDQSGSRQLQYVLTSGNEESKSFLTDLVIPYFVQMSKNVFGNYVTQKLIEVANDDALHRISEIIRKNMKVLSMNSYGCRVVQKYFEIIDFEEEEMSELVQLFFSTELEELIGNTSSNHVIQKIVHVLPVNKLDFITERFLAQTVEMCNDPFACRVLQKLIVKLPNEKKNEIFSNLQPSYEKLCYCQFGNYLIQHLIEKGESEYATKIRKIVLVQFVRMSSDKFASNVVEKALDIWGYEFIEEVFEYLSTYNEDSEHVQFLQLMMDSFGNYVAQRIFNKGDESLKRKIFSLLQSIDPEAINSNNFSKHVFANIQNHFKFGSKPQGAKPNAPKKGKKKKGY